MRICIMTFWWSADNYGQLLQAYALSQYLKNQGHQVELIDYGYLHHPVMRFGERVLKLCNGAARYEKTYPRDFDRFRADHLTFTLRKYRTFASLAKNPPQADMLICGSDQVWHYRAFGLKMFVQWYTNTYMLNFGRPDCIRLAYAASLGVTKILPEEEAMIGGKLKRFSGIGLREKASVSMIAGVASSEVQWVPDPTMLLVSQAFDRLCSDVKVEKPAYFVYYLGNRSAMKGQDIIKVLRDEGKDYAYTSSQFENDYEANRAPTIGQWISLIKHAGTIITNSFHGIVFAITYQKDFLYVPLMSELAGTDTRILSLFERLGITGRALKTPQDVWQAIHNAPAPIDWSQVSQKMTIFRQEGTAFLTRYIGTESSGSGSSLGAE